MTVEELIEELKKFSPKSYVVCSPEDSDIGIPIIRVHTEAGDVIIEFRDEEY